MATLFILAAGLARLERMATTTNIPSSVEQRRRTSWRKRLQQGLQSHPFSQKMTKTGSFFARRSGPWRTRNAFEMIFLKLFTPILKDYA
ncbi:hypothetical protein B0T26DRAFT_267879 [Lasiosphaeria miniovina]|uniref:Secreted protein n=1 Tax=Lasiosphaeria miniovina TaxID=1954250 RepID=A0AA40AJD6_9PEZI|nr:uncharacterized protein B0T26DRAFT_267879 [Lasiosphaeria miniovina]KAK0716830.1 hypothetical protein B0T26DRAFT_267879 [Lasiosphaeria miniovina]